MRLATLLVALLLGSLSVSAMEPRAAEGTSTIVASLPNASVTLRFGQSEVSSIEVLVGSHLATASLSGCGVARSILADSIRVELRMLGPAEDIRDLWVYFDIRVDAKTGDSNARRISLRWVDEKFMYARRTLITSDQSISEDLC